MHGSTNGKPDRETSLNQLYLAIISRYKEYIEEKENISVAELPTLVIPNSTSVITKANEIKSEFLNYNYDENFLEASTKAYVFVKDGISEIILPLQFWMTPEETMTFMLGDSMDKNILLCSILVSLGNPSAKVLVRMEGNSRKVFVYHEFNSTIYVLDMENETRTFISKDEMLASLNMNEDTTAYEFNNQMYSDLY
jgi:hypothetical protein